MARWRPGRGPNGLRVTTSVRRGRLRPPVTTYSPSPVSTTRHRRTQLVTGRPAVTRWALARRAGAEHVMISVFCRQPPAKVRDHRAGSGAGSAHRRTSTADREPAGPAGDGFGRRVTTSAHR